MIGNAIKYHGEKKPEIEVSFQDDALQWTFFVKDNGIGIAPKHQEKIFQMFQRLHTREEYEGTGINVTIAKRIVERHGGHIWVDSEEGKGSTFYFTIPKVMKMFERMINILVAEDNKGDVMMIKEMLGETGLPFHIDVVNNGNEALIFLDRPSIGEMQSQTFSSLISICQ